MKIKSFICMLLLLVMYTMVDSKAPLSQLIAEMKQEMEIVDEEKGMTWKQYDIFKDKFAKVCAIEDTALLQKLLLIEDEQELKKELESVDIGQKILSDDELSFLKSMIYYDLAYFSKQKYENYIIDRLNGQKVEEDSSIDYQDGKPASIKQLFVEECFLHASLTDAAKTIIDLLLSASACKNCVENNRKQVLRAYERKFGSTNLENDAVSLRDLFESMKNECGSFSYLSEDNKLFIEQTLQKMAQHPNFDKPVLVNSEIDDLRCIMLQTLHSSESEEGYDPIFWKQFLVVDAKDYALIEEMSKKYTEIIGVEDRPNRGLPPCLDERRCFEYARWNYLVGFRPKQGDEDVTAKDLYDVLLACQTIVPKNKKLVAERCESMQKNQE